MNQNKIYTFAHLDQSMMKVKVLGNWTGNSFKAERHKKNKAENHVTTSNTNLSIQRLHNDSQTNTHTHACRWVVFWLCQSRMCHGYRGTKCCWNTQTHTHRLHLRQFNQFHTPPLLQPHRTKVLWRLLVFTADQSVNYLWCWDSSDAFILTQQQTSKHLKL